MSKIWKQIGGDQNPGRYGALIARISRGGDDIEIVEIQPVLEHVGDAEARQVGFPFWSNEASYSKEDLRPGSKEMQDAMRSYDVTEEDLPEGTGDNYWFALAEIAMRYGIGVDPGPSGFAEDVVPGKVKWWSGKVAGPNYLLDEDKAFRRLLKERPE